MERTTKTHARVGGFLDDFLFDFRAAIVAVFWGRGVEVMVVVPGLRCKLLMLLDI